MSTSVSSAAKYFPTAQDGFTTTLNGGISSGAATVPLASTGSYSNDDIVVLTIEPGTSGKEQVFTGVMDVGGSQVTSVVWTKGSNVPHSSGVTISEYVSATHQALNAAGWRIAHNDDGTHKSGATYLLPVIANFSNAVHDHSNSAGGGQLGTSALAAGSVTDAKLVYGKVRTRQGGSATDWSSGGTTTYDYSATDTFIQTGAIAVDSNDKTITFPTAFNQVPIVLACVITAAGFNTYVRLKTLAATSFHATVLDDTGAAKTTETISWIAIGQ